MSPKLQAIVRTHTSEKIKPVIDTPHRGAVTYAETDACCASFLPFLEAVVADIEPHQVCDVGGGANPLLQLDYLARRRMRCTVLDISAAELAKAPPGYDTLVADIAARNFCHDGRRFDLVFSRMLAEHVPDGEQFHRNVLALLHEGGYAVHCFPTMYSLPFVINRWIPERAADRALAWIQPRDRYQHAKFPAFYDWCRGPSQRQLLRFTRLGFDVVAYHGLFGHPYYGPHGPLSWLHRRKTAYLLGHPQPALTSYAYVVLRKPVRPEGIAQEATRAGVHRV